MLWTTSVSRPKSRVRPATIVGTPGGRRTSTRYAPGLSMPRFWAEASTPRLPVRAFMTVARRRRSPCWNRSSMVVLFFEWTGSRRIGLVEPNQTGSSSGLTVPMARRASPTWSPPTACPASPRCWNGPYQWTSTMRDPGPYMAWTVESMLAQTFSGTWPFTGRAAAGLARTSTARRAAPHEFRVIFMVSFPPCNMVEGSWGDPVAGPGPSRSAYGRAAPSPEFHQGATRLEGGVVDGDGRPGGREIGPGRACGGSGMTQFLRGDQDRGGDPWGSEPAVREAVIPALRVPAGPGCCKMRIFSPAPGDPVEPGSRWVPGGPGGGIPSRRRPRNRRGGATWACRGLQRRARPVVGVRQGLHEDGVDLEDDLAQEPGLLGVGQEGALEAADEDPLHLVGRQAEGPRRQRVLLGQVRVRHGAVVGVERDPQAHVEVLAERVVLEALHRAGLHVRGEAHLERDAVVVHVVEEAGVLAQARAVADAVRAAVVERLGDRGRPESLPGVDRRRQVVVGDEAEGALVVLRRVVLLLAGEVEGDDAAVLVGDGQLRQLERAARADVPHAADDDAGRQVELALGAPEPRQHGLEDGRQLEPLRLVEDRRVAHLHVPHVLGRAVLGQLVGDALERIRHLQHRQRDVERLEVVAQAPHLRPGDELPRQLGRGLRRQADALLLRQLPDRARPERSVEVEVEVGLRQAAQRLGREAHAFPSGTGVRSRSSSMILSTRRVWRPPANGVLSHTSSIRRASPGLTTEAPSASTFASLCSRLLSTVFTSWHSAQRTPGTRLAAMVEPMPAPSMTTPRAARPVATASPTAFAMSG